MYLHTCGENNADENAAASSPSPYDEKEVINILNPKEFKIEKHRNFIWDYIWKHCYGIGRQPGLRPERGYTPANAFWSIYQANKLKRKYELENNFTYDMVIRCRYDIGLNEESIDSNTMIYVLQNKNIMIGIPGIGFRGPTTWEQTNSGQLPGLDDQFAYGPSREMDIYSAAFFSQTSAYNDLGEMHKFKGENSLGPEVLLKYHLDKELGEDKILIKPSLTHTIIRP